MLIWEKERFKEVGTIFQVEPYDSFHQVIEESRKNGQDYPKEMVSINMASPSGEFNGLYHDGNFPEEWIIVKFYEAVQEKEKKYAIEPELFCIVRYIRKNLEDDYLDIIRRQLESIMLREPYLYIAQACTALRMSYAIRKDMELELCVGLRRDIDSCECVGNQLLSKIIELFALDD